MSDTLILKIKELTDKEPKDWPYPEEMFAKDLLKAWHLSGRKDTIPTDRIWSAVTICCQFFVKTYGENWLVVEMYMPQETRLFFYHRATPETGFLAVFPEKGVEIDHKGRKIFVDFLGQKMEITAAPIYKDLWPWVLLGIDKTRENSLRRLIATQKLVDLISERADANPLTILMRSPQPYRGLGFQIAKKLEEIREILD